MKALHQFVPSLLNSDAIGSHVLEIKKTLDAFGIQNEIFVSSEKDDHVGIAHPFSKYPKMRNDGDILLYHVAGASAMADFLSSRKEIIWIDYHNITPSAFFDGWDDRTSASQHIGRIQLERLSEIAQLALADSQFNESELIDLGFSTTRVLPILFNPANFQDAAIDPTNLREEKQRWLFVGRITPGKAQHNLIRSFAAYRELYNPHCELYLVGKPATPRYFDSLSAMVDNLGLNDAVFLTKGVSAQELSIYYQTADIFVSLSEHEGFCVPLLEAMHYELPILALASSAVPETLADAGVLIESADPLRVATAVDLVLRDQGLVEDLRRRAKDRLAQLSLENARTALRNLLNSYGLVDGERS